ncbi:Fis family transcriptional regulator [Chitiniphilus purpureus]|uniref:Putative Fis-like DNA-binding protein n=1 Tax=Chitiniphilus purpureus TaxID=2981137 RepID=A0ABY6DLM0_9NEIS|nr:helix-turn-helix domain-containing protein [Chitiniphilus sp. CD1]UXY15108.1 Fis family transcriptional regulator [Chitiniphilus sp. CD1]
MTEQAERATLREGDPIAEAIVASLEQYFHDLDGEAPCALYDMVLARVEKPLLRLVLARVGGNQTRAAEMLGINRNTLRKKLQGYDLL